MVAVPGQRKQPPGAMVAVPEQHMNPSPAAAMLTVPERRMHPPGPTPEQWHYRRIWILFLLDEDKIQWRSGASM